jgi:hypothetical protein
MKLKELKQRLQLHSNVGGDLLFRLEDGTLIPPYFHITEMGLKIKHFVDCGGTLRTEQYLNFQIWTADDFDHRLTSQKLLELINKNEGMFNQQELEIEMEYQTNTIGSYTLETSDFPSALFILKPKKTNCLAPDKCLIPSKKDMKPVDYGAYPESMRKGDVTTQKPKQCGPSCC